MNCLDGTWFWVLCKLGVHAPLASSFTYVSRVPESRVGLPQSQSRRGANAPVSSAAPSGRLWCQLCGGMRSRTYHWRHYHDPIAYPTIGVCSRRRTGCADAKMLKERSTVDSAMERSIAELPGWEYVLDPK
ncbi:hypothetical protein BDW62DRAFT_212720 [Aspergillus aurantiobrunneus]